MLNLFSVELLCKNNVTKAELSRCCLQTLLMHVLFVLCTLVLCFADFVITVIPAFFTSLI